MIPRFAAILVAAALGILALSGCDALPGRPRPTDRAAVPSQATTFSALYSQHCAGCHGADGTGGAQGGSVVDASYLALVSDQALRTAVIAGRTDLGMPDWRQDVPGQALTPQEIADVVAWLISQRRPAVGRTTSSAEAKRPQP
jgi:mono/diheme cytochrome c family protein